jgi:hypothetical protein
MVIGRRIATVLLFVLAAGCATRTSTRPVPQRERDVLTRSEIINSAQRDLDLFRAIQSLRPHFLVTAPGVRSRGSTASSATAVYVDRVRQSGLDALRTLQASGVDEVRYLGPVAAQSEFGPTASGGAVIVTLHKDSGLLLSSATLPFAGSSDSALC